MIILTRLGGHTLAVNPDLIERAEATPDTVVTMTDGHKFVVAESLDTLVERVRAWRAGVTAAAYRAVADADLLTAGRSSAGHDASPRVEHLALVTALGATASGTAAPGTTDLSTPVLPKLRKES